MKEIKIGEEIYAIHASMSDLKEGSEWFGERHESLQASRMKYAAGKTFKVHRHILNPRTIKITQESFVVISGRMAIDIYDIKGNLLGTLEVGPGEAVFIYRGGHGVRVLEDLVAYEVKAGSFSYVSEDKEFQDGL